MTATVEEWKQRYEAALEKYEKLKELEHTNREYEAELEAECERLRALESTHLQQSQRLANELKVAHARIKTLERKNELLETRMGGSALADQLQNAEMQLAQAQEDLKRAEQDAKTALNELETTRLSEHVLKRQVTLLETRAGAVYGEGGELNSTAGGPRTCANQCIIS